MIGPLLAAAAATGPPPEGSVGITPAVATIIVAIVTVLGAALGAVVSFWLNRNNNSADTAEKISKAWVPVFSQYDRALEQVQEQCDTCQAKLKQSEERAVRNEKRLAAGEKRERELAEVLRTLVRVYDSKDPTQMDAVIAEIRRMLR